MRILGITALLALGCGSGLSSAVAEFDGGRPAAAKRCFSALEPEFSGLGPKERTRYALYRGLTHLTLGDASQADPWLSFAKRESDRDLDLLSAAERGSLLAAWKSIGRMPGDLGVR